MNLSAELFQAVVQSLRLDESGARADSGLRARRVRLAGRAIITPFTGETRHPVEVVARNVSPSGISITLPLRMIRGDRFILHLPRASGCLCSSGECNSLLCTVARYQYLDESLYTLGATFTRVLRASPVHGLCKP